MSFPSEEERFLANVLDLSDLVHELTTICWDEGIKDINPILENITSLINLTHLKLFFFNDDISNLTLFETAFVTLTKL